MTEEELLREIKRLNNGIDGISDDLINVIEKYQREYERSLYKINFDVEKGYIATNMSNYRRAMSIDAFSKLGFEQIGISYISQYNNIADARINFASKIGVDTSLTFKDLEILKQLKEIDLTSIYAKGEELDNAIKKALVNAVATGQSYEETIKSIREDLLGAGDKMGLLAKYADTYLRTSLFGLSRMIDKEIYESVGGFDKYLYAGTIDGKIRPFCVAHVGNVYTEKQILKFPEQNGSGLDPWFAPGGWNCRHFLIPANEIE